MGEDEDLFGRLAVEQGLVKPAQFEECVRLRGELERAGVRPAPTVGELLVRKGYLTPQQAQDTMRLTRASGSSRSGSPEPPAEAVEAGKTPANAVGKYVRTAKIGTGGMGEVWRAWDRELGRWVALKFLRGDDPDELARFEREAQTAAKLSHPNIAAVYEVGQHAGRPFIAMQLIEGESLATFPRGDRRLLADVVREAALAVHHAHEQGVIHRDVKPHNIMVEGAPVAAPRSGSSRSARLRVYVLDFGLAKHAAVNSSVSVSGSIVGTPSYMPPEQARGAHGRADARSDVYSLGATLYDILAGRPPFQEESLAALLMKLVQEDPPPLRQADPKIDAELETIVAKCLEKDPARRYPTALALAEDLGRWLEGEPIVARPPSLGYRVRKRLVKHAALSVAIAAAVLAALVAAGTFVQGALKRAATLAEMERRADGLMKESGEAFARGEWPRAQEKLGQYLALRPDDARAAGMKRDCEARLASIRKEAEDKPAALEAAELCRQALDHVKDAQILLRTRTARREQWEREFTEAARLADAAIARFPTLASGHLTRGEILHARGRWNEAVAALDAALKLDPGMAAAYHRRGLCHLRRYLESKGSITFGGREDGPVALDEDAKERAMSDLHRHQELRGGAGDFPRQFLQVAVATAEDRYADAARGCDALLRENATDDQVWLFKSLAEMGQNRLKEARETLDRLLQDVVPNHVHAYFVRAQLRMFAKDLKGAMGDLDQAISLDPTIASFYYHRGSVKGNLGDWKGDVEDCTKAIELQPDFAAAWSNRGVAKGNLGDWPGEIEDCSRAIELNPRFGMALNGRAAAFARLGRFPEAVADLRKAIELEPRYEALLRRNLGQIRADAGDPEGGLEDLTRAVELGPKLYDAHYLRGQVLRRLKRPKEASAALEKAAGLQPGSSAAQLELGFAFQDAGDKEGAYRAFDRALSLGARSARAFNERGTQRWHRKEIAAAKEDFAKAVEIDPKYQVARFNLAMSLSNLGDPQGSIREYTALLELDPQYRHALANRARQKWSLKDYEGALADARAAVAKDDRDADAWAVLGASKLRMKDAAGGEADCSKAVQIDKDHSWGRYNRGEARAELGRWKEAAEDFSWLLDREPGNSYALFSRGRALLRLGEPARALADLRRAVEISADRKAEAAPLIAECEKALGK